MQKIYPAWYIYDTDPVAAMPRRVSTWFITETSGSVPEESQGWMQAQGWVVTGSTLQDGKTTYSMTRRRIDSEKVLQDMITDYTACYNEGRYLNDKRYDEILAIYMYVQSTTEDEFNVEQAGDAAYEALIETLLSGIASDYTSHASSVTGALDNYGNSIRTQINGRFDNRLASARQELVGRGMFNSTLWESVAAGIERERSLALSDLEDKITQQQLGQKHQLYGQKTTMRTSILAARDRLRSFITAASDRRLASRNAILQAMMNFMERRTDSYPDIAEIGRLAASLGAGNPTSFTP